MQRQNEINSALIPGYSFNKIRTFYKTNIGYWNVEKAWKKKGFTTFEGNLLLPKNNNGDKYLNRCVEHLGKEAQTLVKVIHSKYSKHWPYTVALTINSVCWKC